MQGYPYTWERGRGTPGWIEEKVDRALATRDWFQKFQGAVVLNADTSASDHTTIFLCTKEGLLQGDTD